MWYTADSSRHDASFVFSNDNSSAEARVKGEHSRIRGAPRSLSMLMSSVLAVSRRGCRLTAGRARGFAQVSDKKSYAERF